MMDEHGKSDRPVVPQKPPNNAPERVAEVVEGRERTKGNAPERNAPRTQSRASAPSALERVRQAAAKDKRQRFTVLLHHVYDLERLRAAYLVRCDRRGFGRAPHTTRFSSQKHRTLDAPDGSQGGGANGQALGDAPADASSLASDCRILAISREIARKASTPDVHI